VKQTLRHIGFAAIVVTWSALAAAQATGKPAVPPAAAPTPAPAPGTQQASPAEPYSYDPAGRRDPFVSLVARGAQPTAGSHTGGLSGLSTAEVVVTGIYQGRIAFLKGPDGKTFQARVNDHLADGIIRSITPQAVVIMQEVNDPLSLVKVKEVRKGLRASDDVKQ
jgi:hypothetical protein